MTATGRPDPAGLWAVLADLVLPVGCAGCRAERVPLTQGVCADCVATLRALRPARTAPTPVPPGMPDCFALGAYQAPLRETLLAYKERGRHGLARPLGSLLAEVVAEAVGGPRPVVLVPVPATARAARARHGDHLRRLTRQAAGRLRRAGWPVLVARPLRALPRPDSAELDSAGRAQVAATAFRVRGGLARLRQAAAEHPVVLLDDIVTTGATLAAVNRLLAANGVPVAVAAVLAATIRRRLG